MASDKQLKEKQFKEKLKVLNEEFVDFVSLAFQENPFYDFTPPVTDYLKHVKELDECYAEKPPATERKIVVAKRRITKPASGNAVEKSSINTSKPAIPEPKKLSNGFVEPSGQFDFAPKVQMPSIPSATVTPSSLFSAPKSTDATGPSPQNRKRRQEPLDYDDMRRKSSNDYGKADKEPEPPRIVPSNIAALGAKLNAEKESTGKSLQTSSLFSNTSSLFSGSDKPPGASLFNFGVNNPATTFSPKVPEISSSAAAAPPLFSALKSTSSSIPSSRTPESVDKHSEAPKKTVTFNLAASEDKSNSEKEGVEKSPQTSSLFSVGGSSLFGTPNNKPAGTSIFNFGAGNNTTSASTVTNGQTSSSIFSGLPKLGGAPAFNLKGSDGSSLASTTAGNNLFGSFATPGGNLSFTFNKGPDNSTSTGAAANGETDNKEGGGEEGDAEDAPPPKVEAIKHEEPDAVFSTKCSLFNYVDGEYKKVGVGFLHIKKTESGTQLLIRAATALGTVWVNTYINKSFKAEKKAKDKIQFSYPSPDGAKTSLVRVVDVDDAVAYLTGEKKP